MSLRVSTFKFIPHSGSYGVSINAQESETDAWSFYLDQPEQEVEN